MKRIHEMNAAELTTCICKIAEPSERIFSDGAVIDALDTMRGRVPENVTIETAFGLFAKEVVPVLTGDAHRKDTYEIVAALCEQTVEEVEQRNGLEVMRDMFYIFALEKDVEGIFRPCNQARR